MMFTACFGGVPEGGREVRGRRQSDVCITVGAPHISLSAKGTEPSMNLAKYCFLYANSLKGLKLYWFNVIHHCHNQTWPSVSE